MRGQRDLSYADAMRRDNKNFASDSSKFGWSGPGFF